MLERAELPIEVGDADLDRDGVELARLAHELVLEGPREDVEMRRLEIEVRHRGIKEKLAGLADIHAVHAEVDIADRVGIGIGRDGRIDKPLAFEVPGDVMHSAFLRRDDLAARDDMRGLGDRSNRRNF